MIHDVCLESAPDSNFGSPGMDDISQKTPILSDEILDELPPGCRQAFDAAHQREESWRSQWTTESADGKRAKFMRTVEWFP